MNGQAGGPLPDLPRAVAGADEPGLSGSAGSPPEDVVAMPAMSAAQSASWLALMDLHDAVREGWTLVGGQLVHLHCAERGASPERATTDADTVVDVRMAPGMLETFTRALQGLGFTPDTSGDGLQHRWRREEAQVDVLLPDGIGERATSRLGVGGAPTLSTPGGTQALARTSAVSVEVDGRVGTVLRPNLLGALVMKAAAHDAVGDAARGRHRSDFVVLAGLLGRRDITSEALTKKDRQRLRLMIAACRADPGAMAIANAADALTRLEIAAALT
ncbi:hypothetical protein ACXR8F_21405 [Terrabacter sp. AAH1]